MAFFWSLTSLVSISKGWSIITSARSHQCNGENISIVMASLVLPLQSFPDCRQIMNRPDEFSMKVGWQFCHPSILGFESGLTVVSRAAPWVIARHWKICGMRSPCSWLISTSAASIRHTARHPHKPPDWWVGHGQWLICSTGKRKIENQPGVCT